MKYMILPAKKLQCGDVVIDQSKGLCGRVLGQNMPDPSKRGVVAYRIDVMEGNETGHTTIEFLTQTPVGVAREDEYAEVDVAALLAEMDR